MEVKRLFIDCSFVAFNGQMTGIPRVVQKYAEFGLRFGLEKKLDVLLVGCSQDGNWYLKEDLDRASSPIREKHSIAAKSGTIAAKVLMELTRYFMRLSGALINFISALFPLTALKRANHALASQQARILTLMRQRLGLNSSIEQNFSRVEFCSSDILLCTSYWHDLDPSAYESVKGRGAEIALLLHDILPVTHPEFYHYPWRWWFEKRLARSLDYVSHYYCISDYTRNDLLRFASRHQKKIRTSVAYNGFEQLNGRESRAVSPKLASVVAERPWLMVGTLEPKKRHREIFKIFETLWDKGYQRPLVIIGRRGWMCDDIVETLHASRWYDKRLFWLEAVSDQELSAFYHGAHALLFGSFAEGFGLPLLEAASHNLPILSRDMTPAREILGDKALFFAMTSDCVELIEKLEDSVAYAIAREKLSLVTWFPWSTVVECVISDVVTPIGLRRDGLDLLDRKLMTMVYRNPERSAIIRVLADNMDEVKALLKLLEPSGVVGFQKIRIGAQHDGGYIMINDFENVPVALSLGVGNNVEWDVAIAERGIRVLQFDHTVEQSPLQRDGLSFHSIKIVPSTSQNPRERTIQSILQDIELSSDLILKMDIENDEWGVLRALNESEIRRFRQIVIEFHEFRQIGETSWRARASDIFNKIARTHFVAHVHANNYAPPIIVGPFMIPDIVEITFIRRSNYTPSNSQENFPTQYDTPNDPNVPDLYLGAFRFNQSLNCN